jgi:hypothetical protein
MSREDDILVGGHWLPPMHVKVIGLMSAGATNKQVEDVLCRGKGTIHNYCNFLYSVLHVESSVNALASWGLLNGFDHKCYLNGNDVLDDDERQRLYVQMPCLKTDKRRVKVIITNSK